MKKIRMASLLFSLSIGALSFAAAPPHGQSSDTQRDHMTKDTMSQDGMAKDKMSPEMAEAKVLKGWLTDSECAAEGNKKCGNKEHVARGAKLVIVTDGDNKIWTIANPQAVAGHQGHYIQLKAVPDMDKHTLTVQDVKMLKQGK